MKSTTMRELSATEMKEVSGGIAPLIGLAISAAGHFMARSVASSMLGRAGFGLSVYGAAEYFGSTSQK